MTFLYYYNLIDYSDVNLIEDDCFVEQRTFNENKSKLKWSARKQNQREY